MSLGRVAESMHSGKCGSSPLEFSQTTFREFNLKCVSIITPGQHNKIDNDDDMT